MEKIKYPCGTEFDVNYGNSDANCHRQKRGYATKLVSETDFKICKGCVYNEQEIAEQALKEKP